MGKGEEDLKKIVGAMKSMVKGHKGKIPMRHRKARCFLIYDVPVDVLPEVVALNQIYCQETKRIVLCAASKDPIPLKMQQKMRDSVHKVLASPEADTADIISAFEKFIGEKLPRKDDLRYMG